jgi:hypothetical protein
VLIVHVGTQKTGTKSLQRHLSFNSDALLGQGIRYLLAGREKCGRAGRYGSHHNELARAIQGRADIAMWNRVRDELAQSDSRVDLISGEGFWFSDPAVLRQQLPGVKDIRIVVYLRRQDRYLQSLYMQGVGGGGRKESFAAWREKVPDRGKYLAAIDKWSDAFGSESIVIRPYDRNGVVDTIEDFNKLIGAEGLTRYDGHGNPSPRVELLHFIRAFNQLGHRVDERELFLALVGKDAAYARSCHLLTYEESLALLENYMEENRILIEKYYRDESVPLFPDLVAFEPPDRWELESEAYFKLTMDVLDVLIAFAADGGISQSRVEASANGNLSAADGNANGNSDARKPRRVERLKLRASRRPGARRREHEPTTASQESGAANPFSEADPRALTQE